MGERDWEALIKLDYAANSGDDVGRVNRQVVFNNNDATVGSNRKEVCRRVREGDVGRYSNIGSHRRSGRVHKR